MLNSYNTIKNTIKKYSKKIFYSITTQITTKYYNRVISYKRLAFTNNLNSTIIIIKL